MKSLQERLCPKIDFQLGGCWLWTGHRVGRLGYGRVRVGGAYPVAHRVVYELLVGPIPEGMTLDHLCREPRCVNPTHLEVVTMRENILRGNGVPARLARQTHCLRNHPLSGENLYVRPDGERECRACKRWRESQHLTPGRRTVPR